MKNFKVKEIGLLILTLLVLPAFGSFDGDANTDLFVASDKTGHPTVHWYEYDKASQSQQWRTLVDNYSGEGYYSVASGDLDGDSFPDVLVGSSEKLYWYEAYENDTPTLVDSYTLSFKCNDIFFDDTEGKAYIACGVGAADPNGGVLESLQADGDNSAVMTTLETNSDYSFETVITTDFDGDGKQELFLGYQAVDNPYYGHIHLFEVNPSDGSISWIDSVINGKAGGDAFAAGDLDGDDNVDILLSHDGGSSSGLGYVKWYEADGTDNGLSYKGAVINYKQAAALILTDYDGDNNADLLYSTYPKNDSGSGEAMGWFEADGNDSMPVWREHVFSGSHYGHCLAAGNWDGDGNVDVIAGCRNDAGGNYGLHFHENSGDNTSQWIDDVSNGLYQGKDAVLVEAGGLERVRANLISLWTNEDSGEIETVAQGHIDSMQADGSWSDLDYSQQAQDGWDVNTHYERLFLIARAYQKQGQSLYQSSTVSDAVELGLQYGENNVLNPGGSRPSQTGMAWYWEIGMPDELGGTLVLIQGAVDAAVFQNARDSLVWLIGGTVPAYKGANLTWSADRHVPLAVIDGDTALMYEISDIFAGAALPQPVGTDGYLEDYSFHQHGQLLYNGGYGESYTWTLSTFIRHYVQGTVFQLPQSSIDVFAEYISEGSNYVMYNGYWDTGVLGRNVSRGNQSRMGAGPGVAAMAEVQSASQNELIDIVNSPYNLQGHKHFWHSDFTVHHRPFWYASVRMLSDRTKNAELINDEGYKQWNVADGLLWVLKSGDEYVTDDVLAAMDWTRLPGTTVEQKTKSSDNYGFGDGSLVGGAFVSDYGVSTMNFAHSAVTDLTANKSWFFFDDEVVCLGTDINCPTGNTVETVVAQLPLSSSDAPLIVDGAAKPDTLGWSETLSGIQWVQCDGFGYYFPGGATVKAERDVSSGSWQELKANSEDTTVYSKDFLTMYYDHGTNVSGAGYQYAVVAKMGLSMDDYLIGEPFEVLSNDSSVQAVKDRSSGAVGAVFRQAGSADIVSVDSACVVFYQISGGKFSIGVSEPAHTSSTIEVTIDLDLTNPDLPSGVSSQVSGGQTVLTLNVEDGRNYLSTFDTDVVTCEDVWDAGDGYVADLNRDCTVNLIDFAITAGNWLDCTDPADSACK